jgi:hypothetical protein
MVRAKVTVVKRVLGERAATAFDLGFDFIKQSRRHLDYAGNTLALLYEVAVSAS